MPMNCPAVRGNNPRACSELIISRVQVDNLGITILYLLYQCRHCTYYDIISGRPSIKSEYQNKNLISQLKHMLWLLKEP